MNQNDINNSVQNDDFNTIDDDNYENDDLITFQLDSKKINFYYSQLTKYSKRIRDKYLFSDVNERFPHELQKFQEEYNLSISSIFCFYQILQQNFNIKANSNLKYNECADILKISNEFEIRKLKKQMNEFIKTRSIEVDFIIDMIEYENQLQKHDNKPEIEIKPDIEEILRNKIDECLSNDKFSELPIATIYRIIEKCPKNRMISDKLFDFIKKSISKFYVLFQFVEAEKLSEDRLLELCDLYSKMDKQNKHYFNYLRFNLEFLSEMLNKKKSLEIINQSQQTKMIELEKQIQEKLQLIEKQQKIKNDELESTIKQLKNQLKETTDQLKESKETTDQLNEKLKESKETTNQLNNQLKETTDQLNEKLKISEEEKDKISIKLNEIEKANKELQERLEEELFPFKAVIIPNVKNGLIVNARIKIILGKGTLDSSMSKYIISTSDAKTIGLEAYQKGLAITSLDMNTVDFICKAGTYFVRCIVFSNNGNSKEFVSDKITTSGRSLSFDYKGEQEEFLILPGEYKLEVWGGQGGDSTGKRYPGHENTQNGKGGLGGYSRGILKLNEMEKIHVFVGGSGQPGNSRDGETTSGSFPDGGGTKTGHCNDIPTCVPGTGGGSTSIRLKDNTNYHRVIVAGGGGGASGNSIDTDSGGFGGGKTGGNVSFRQNILNQGSGTQTGSTCGIGCGNEGDPGEFGKGATGKYMQSCDSGGGGGGGWYGGGSGGYGGDFDCSSGGGGSGWVFTGSSFNEWKSGDSTKSSKFLLTSEYHLTDALTLNGDQELPHPNGNGTEKGHRGNGYAKITVE